MKTRFLVFGLVGMMGLLGGECVWAQDDVYFSGKKEKVETLRENRRGQVGDVVLTESGVYEKKEVVEVEGVSAGVLFVRAMEALSDWTGPDGKAKAGVDFQDKETGTVIYKGRYSLGFKNVFLGDGWSRYADFTLKVKTKDGRAQVTVTVPTVTAVYSKNGMTREGTVAQLVEQVRKAKGAKGERGEKLLEDLVGTADGLVKAMGERLKVDVGDDF